MSDHSIYSPSGSSRWLNCTASVQYIEDNKDRCDFGDTTESSEGTIAHEWCAAGLLESTQDEAPDAEMRERVRSYCEFVWELSDGATLHVEEEVPLFYRPEDHGTVDCWFVRNDTLNIVDYKDGAGVKVEAVNNKQLLIYAASVLRLLKVKPARVSMVIFQPQFDNCPTAWDRSSVEVLWAAKGIASKVIDIEMRNIEFAPSETICQFCPAAEFCPHRASSVQEILPAGPLALPVAEEMTDEQLALFVAKKKDFAKWLKDVEGYITRRMVDEGEAVPGLKVVKGRDGNRRWLCQDAADKFLARRVGRYRWEQKLISPTKAEALLKSTGKTHPRTRNRFNELVGRNEGRTVVVPEDDKRNAIPTLECKFQVKD